MASCNAPGSLLDINSSPSSSSPYIASQVLPDASSPSCFNACATRFSCCLVSARWLLNAALSSRVVARSAICGSASINCCSAFSKSFSSSTRCSRSDATEAIFVPPRQCCILCATGSRCGSHVHVLSDVPQHLEGADAGGALTAPIAAKRVAGPFFASNGCYDVQNH